MEDLTRLGKRIIFLGKGVFLSILSITVIFGIISGFFGNPMNIGSDVMSMDIALLALVLLLLLSCLALLVFCGFGGLCMLLWTFRVTKNLRMKSKTIFSPWVSVIGLIIWYINIVVQFVIFRNLTHVQEKLLREAGVDVKPVPLNMLAGWFVASVAAVVLSHIGSNAACVMAGLVLSTVSIVFFLKAFEVFVVQHTALYKLEQEQILQKKVDEVLRDREIERLASEVQQAKYD